MGGYPHDLTHDVPEPIGPRGGQLEPQPVIPIPIGVQLARCQVRRPRHQGARRVPDPPPFGMVSGAVLVRLLARILQSTIGVMMGMLISCAFITAPPDGCSQSSLL